MGSLFPTKESRSSEEEDRSESDAEPTDNKSSEVPMEDDSPF